MQARRDDDQERPYARIGAEHLALRKAEGRRRVQAGLAHGKEGLTQEKLAEESGASEAQISMVEQGKQRPTRDYIEKVAPVLGVGVVWLQRQAGYVVSDDSDELEVGPDTLAIIRGAILQDRRIAPELVPAIETVIRLAMRDVEPDAED